MFAPLSICLEILLIGLFLLWKTKKQKAGKIAISLGVGLLMVVSYPTIQESLLRSLENRYPPILNFQDLQDVRWVVVLGGGHNSDPKLPSTGQISGSSLARLIEGIRIQKNITDGKLILSGGAVFDPVPEAQTMANVAIALGVDEKDIILESDARDTEEQAQKIKKIVKNSDGTGLILVTSAAHMPRSMMVFERWGLQPIPAPVDYRAKKQQGINPKSFFPISSRIRMMESALHEYLGILWLKLKGANK